MKNILLKISLPLLLILPAVASSCARTEKTEAVTADIVAAQMEGRNAAREFIRRDWHDTTGIHRSLDNVRTQRLKYDTIGRNDCSEAFDSAFISTIRTVKPDLANKIRERK